MTSTTTTRKGVNPGGDREAEVEKPNGCTICCLTCCNLCSCCTKPCVTAAILMREDQLNALVDARVAEALDAAGISAPQPKEMARAVKPKEWPWKREKAAQTIQRVFRGRGGRLEAHIRMSLEKLPKGARTKAAAGGLDRIGTYIGEHLGKNVWARAIQNAPDEWEETAMVSRMAEVLTNPKSAESLWVLAKPTKHERVLLMLAKHVGAKSDEQRLRAVVKIQKTFRGRSKRLASMIRFDIEALPDGVAIKAAATGIDGIASAICEHFGKNVWRRAIVNAPDDWEEEQMTFAMKDIFARPRASPHIWLLAKPTKAERMLLTAFSPTGTKKFSSRI